jgi:thimet oligopeptidase
VRPLHLCLLAMLPWAAASAFAQDLSVQSSVWTSKPDGAAFDKIENTYLDAAQRAIDALLAVKAPRTIENTLKPFDEAVQQIDSAAYFAGLMESVHPEEAFRNKATAMVAKSAAAQTALSLNHEVYEAIAHLNLAGSDAATHYYVERQLLEFRLAGVDRDEATRAKLKKLQDDLTKEQSAFGRNINDGENTIAVTDPAELQGLPQDYIERHKPGSSGKIEVNTTYPDFYPVMKFAKSDDLRRRLNVAFETRAYPKNSVVLKQMMQTRYDIAKLLGFSSWADYNARDKMIRSGANIAKFIAELDEAVKPGVAREQAMLLEAKQKAHPGATEIWDYENSYYPEQVRRAKYDFDSQSVRPYFPYQQVKQGILDTAAKLFHVTFRQEPQAPGWDPAVETWDVFDNGKAIGRFYLDMHPRTGKYTHAEMVPVRDGVRGKQLPEAALLCNFPAPTAADPGLMEIGDVTTFFHEFGHLMHHILGGQQRWAGIAGISMESDFVEAPSQMLEELIRSPAVLAGFAKHYQTGKPIPAELVARMNRASAFGRALTIARQNGFSAISYDLYKTQPQDVNLDQVCDEDSARYSGVHVSPGTHLYASFGHLAGYSSQYYTYMWDKEIALDFYAQFDGKNPLVGDTAMRYRQKVLEPGGSVSANDLVKGFLGRPQNMTAFKAWIGEEFSEAPVQGP